MPVITIPGIYGRVDPDLSFQKPDAVPGEIITPPDNSLPAWRGMDVDSFDEIVGNSTREEELLALAISKEINVLYLYSLSGLLGTTVSANKVANFIRQATQQGIKVGAIRGSSNTMVGSQRNSTLTYNNSRTDIQERFTIFNLENEFWNYLDDVGNIELPDSVGNVIFRHWDEYLETIWNSLDDDDVVTNEVYISSHADDEIEGTDPIVICEAIISKVNRTQVAHYVTDVEFATTDRGWNFLDQQIIALAEAAANLDKVCDVVILFANTEEFMKVTFAQYSPVEIFRMFMEYYDTVDFANKEFINVIGFDIYKYTEFLS